MLNSTSIDSPHTSLPETDEQGDVSKRRDVSRILLTVDTELHVRNEFLIQGLTFSCVPIESSPDAADEIVPDAIMILFKPFIQFNRVIRYLKNYADEHCIPFIMYSEEFDKEAKHIALGLRFDDYYYGNLTDSLVKKIWMIKKSKEIKSKSSDRLTDKGRLEKEKMSTIKRGIDIIASSVIIMILSPILLLIALIIKLESNGPIFYVSKRAGNNYRVFDFYKFRTMHNGADSQLKNLSAENQYGQGVFVKIKNDPRVTPFGKVLRKTSLDEIPQLINVIKGDMSLVGNRPLPLYEAEQLTKDGTARRFLAPAGVTGLWQVTKRGKDQMSEQERIQLDIEYAKNYSALYDFRILVNTLPALLQKEAV